MKVCDSSYIVEGLLKKKVLLEEDTLVTPELALYETANSIWKHEFLLKDIWNGSEYLSIFHGLIETGLIQLVQISKENLEKVYSLSAENKRLIFDTVFVALALELGLELANF